MSRVRVIGAGLAGCEAANTLAALGHEVELFEQKPLRRAAAQKTDELCELVCSNSFKAARTNSAAGLLKAEMRLLGSLCLEIADGCSVAAGGALAVDRELFSPRVGERIRSNPNITLRNEIVERIDESVPTIVASGPLTDGELAQSLFSLCGESALSFYDAAAPIVTAESIDMQKVCAASRYDRGGDDYLNCYFDKARYEEFYEQLVNAQGAVVHDFDVYEGCMPIEKLAKRGKDAMRFGPMKPVGLRDPATGHRPYAAVQLRRENEAGTLWNLVGFQTNLKFGEQKRVFSMIPGLENAQFARYGVMHRNTFVNSPVCLEPTLCIKGHPNVYVAGQLTGFEGYMESAASGILAARFLSKALRGESADIPSELTMLGAMLRYITSPNKDFQPMGANMGVLPELEEHIRDKQLRYEALAQRALEKMKEYCDENSD